LSYSAHVKLCILY